MLICYNRIKALEKWKGKFGFYATYEALLRVFVNRKAFGCANKLVTLLGAQGEFNWPVQMRLQYSAVS